MDCDAVALRGISLKELFLKVDELLSYSLSDSFNRVALRQQLAILDSEELARVIIFCLDSYDEINIVEFLNKVDMDQELHSNLRFLVAKYGPKYNQLWSMDVNEHGWKNIRYSVIQRAEDVLMLELFVYLYNGSILTIRDDAESILELASHLVEGVPESINSTLLINNLF